MLRFKKLLPNIYAVEGNTSAEVARLFLRFQESYESPKFRNKIFSLQKFKRWYKAVRREKRFSYYSTWIGFNVPGYVFRPFMGEFGKLSQKERWLLTQIINKVDLSQRFYILGYKRGSNDTKKHEIAHAKFYTNLKYRKAVLEVLSDLRKNPALKKLKKNLRRSGGYHKSVILDECHAYILASEESLKKEKFWNARIAKAKIKLEKIFETF